jgi:adenosine kinase
MEGVILGVGNPLLDISAPVPKSLLDKYGVELNNAVLAEEKHLPVYEELVREHEVEYIAGGATQNSIRVAQWILQRPGATAYIGCVGKDKFGSQLKSCAEEDGVAVHYLEDAETPTGTCAVLVVNKERSLIANLAAANKYKAEHLSLPEIVPVWTRARIVYISGFFLTVSPPAIMFLAEQCRSMGKTFIMNLAAPFISQFFSEPLLGALPFVDIIIGNESEAKAFGEKMGFPVSCLCESVL